MFYLKAPHSFSVVPLQYQILLYLDKTNNTPVCADDIFKIFDADGARFYMNTIYSMLRHLTMAGLLNFSIRNIKKYYFLTEKGENEVLQFRKKKADLETLYGKMLDLTPAEVDMVWNTEKTTL